jgi:DNA-binding transcriptional LysR family regulator
MDFEQLKTFANLSNSNNFTRTAEEMNVVQSTVTTRIKMLEEEVGETLFLRRTRNVELTDSGKTFLTYVTKTLEIMDEGMKATRIQSKFSESLVIGGMNSLWETPILEQINQYQSSNPSTSLRLITGHSEDIIEKIRYGLIDVGFVYNPLYSSMFNVEVVKEESILLVGARQLVEKLSLLTSKDLKDIPFIHYNWGSDFSEWFEEEVGKHETMPYRVDHAGVALRLILNGEGIGFVLESMIRKYEENDLISRVSFNPKEIIPTRKVYMVSTKRKKERLNTFLQYMVVKNKEY